MTTVTELRFRIKEARRTKRAATRERQGGPAGGVRQGVALYAYENIQTSIKRIETFRLLGCGNRTFSRKNLRIHSHRRTAAERAPKDGARERKRVEGAREPERRVCLLFLPLLTSYSRAYFLRQPSRIVNVNLLFFFSSVWLANASL